MNKETSAVLLSIALAATGISTEAEVFSKGSKSAVIGAHFDSVSSDPPEPVQEQTGSFGRLQAARNCADPPVK